MVCVVSDGLVRAQPARIMPLGDSITRGSNDINYPNGDIPGGYRRKLGELLSDAEIEFDFIGALSDNAAPGMDPDHNGNNGFRSDQILSILPELLTTDPDVVLMMAGTNDILQNVPAAAALANLRNLIVQITSDDPDRRLFVATIPPITQNWNGQSAASLNANAGLYNSGVRNLIEECASHGRKVVLVDMNALIVLNDPDPAKCFFQPGDGVHPGQAGYDQLGGFWFEAITAGGSLVDAPLPDLPARPQSLTVSVAGPGRINLAWSDVADNESAYRVFSRPASAGVWQEIASLPANAVRHVVTGLVNGLESYGFAVQAMNAAGGSAWSPVVFSPSPGDRAHLKPASASSVFANSPAYAADKGNDGRQDTLWASGTGGNHYWQVDLQAGHHLQQLRFVTRQDNNVADHRRNFEIRVSNDPAFSSYQVLSSQGSSPLPFKAVLTRDLAGLQGYRYLRVAKTDNTSFAFTLLQAYGTEQTSAPVAPAGLAVDGAGDRWVRLEWEVASNNEGGFLLERRTGAAGAFTWIASPSAGTNRFLDTTASPGTEYSYRLRAMNESGNSPYTNEVSVITSNVTGYQTWAATYPEFSALSPSEKLPSADANGDGIPNLLAYAAGIDPMKVMAADTLSGLDVGPNGEWYFRYLRNRNALDLTYEVLSESQPGGDTWLPVDPSPATVTEVEGLPGLELVKVPILPAFGQSRMFLKLKITMP